MELQDKTVALVLRVTQEVQEAQDSLEVLEPAVCQDSLLHYFHTMQELIYNQEIQVTQI